MDLPPREAPANSYLSGTFARHSPLSAIHGATASASVASPLPHANNVLAMKLLVLNAKGRFQSFDAGEERSIVIADLFLSSGICGRPSGGADLLSQRGMHRFAIEERLC